VNVELFVKAKKEWLEKIIELPNRIPSHDTFGVMFAKIDATQFTIYFMNWIQSIQKRSQGEIGAIDGK